MSRSLRSTTTCSEEPGGAEGGGAAPRFSVSSSLGDDRLIAAESCTHPGLGVCETASADPDVGPARRGLDEKPRNLAGRAVWADRGSAAARVDSALAKQMKG